MLLIPTPTSWLLIGVAIAVAGLVVAVRGDRFAPARGAALIGIGVFALVLLGCFALHEALPGLLGLPVVLGPNVSAAAALIAFATIPWRRRRGGLRTASLEARRATGILRRRDLLVPALAASLLIPLLLVGGWSGSPDDQGRLRAFTLSYGPVTSTGGPYPGWWYSAPLLVSVALLAGAALLAMRRTAVLPAVAADAATETAWRRTAQRILAAVVGAALLLDTAGVALAIGLRLRSASDVLPPGVARSLLDTATVVLLAAAPLLGLTALAVLVGATVRSATVGRALRPRPLA